MEPTTLDPNTPHTQMINLVVDTMNNQDFEFELDPKGDVELLTILMILVMLYSSI